MMAVGIVFMMCLSAFGTMCFTTVASAAPTENPTIIADIESPTLQWDGEKTSNVITLTNTGDKGTGPIIADVYLDGVHMSKGTLHFGNIPAGKSKDREVKWTPDKPGVYTMDVRVSGEILKSEMFTVIRSDLPVTWWGNKTVSGYEEYEDVTIVVTEDLTVTGTFILRNSVIILDPITFTNDWKISGSTVFEGVEVIMDSNSDGEWSIILQRAPTEVGALHLLKDTESGSRSWIHPKEQENRYNFIVDGELYIDDSTVQGTYGDISDLTQPGGIQVNSDGILEVSNNAIIEDGETHGIYVNGAGVNPGTGEPNVKIQNSQIINNGFNLGTPTGGSGIYFTNDATGLVEGNTISGNDYAGVYVSGSNPIIQGNDITTNHHYGIYTENSPGASASTTTTSVWDGTSDVTEYPVEFNNGVPITSMPYIKVPKEAKIQSATMDLTGTPIQTVALSDSYTNTNLISTMNNVGLLGGDVMLHPNYFDNFWTLEAGWQTHWVVLEYYGTGTTFPGEHYWTADVPSANLQGYVDSPGCYNGWIYRTFNFASPVNAIGIDTSITDLYGDPWNYADMRVYIGSNLPSVVTNWYAGPGPGLVPGDPYDWVSETYSTSLGKKQYYVELSEPSTQVTVAYHLVDVGGIATSFLVDYLSVSPYSTNGDITSVTVPTAHPILSATPTWDSTIPTETTLEVLLSVDGGVSWQMATNGVEMVWPLNPSNNILQYKAILQSTNSAKTPRLHDILIELKYNTLDPTLDIGNDGDIDWSHPGTFDTTETVPNFAQELQEQLRLLPADANGNVLIPLTLSSLTTGRIVIDNVNIIWQSPIHIMGNNIENHPQDGIYIDTSGNVQIEANKITNNANGIYTTNSHCQIISNTPTTALMEGIYSNSCGISINNDDASLVEDNEVYGNTYDGIYLTGLCSDVTILSNEIHDNQRNGIYCFSFGSSLSVRIENNNHIFNHLNDNCAGIQIYNRADFTIDGNTIDSNYAGIHVDTSDSGAISGNTIQFSTQYEILIASCQHVTINGNTITGTSAQTQTGIFLALSHDSTISSNAISDVSGGIVLQDSNLNNIHGNTISQTDIGVDTIGDLSSDNIIGPDNELYSNGIAVRVISNSANTITGNNIHENDYSIYTHNAPVVIEHNTIGQAYIVIEHEQVPAIIGESEISLANGNILNCTLYLNDGSLTRLEEWTDYILNYDTGEIELATPVQTGWLYYAYYNYSDGNGNTHGIIAISATPTINENSIIANDEAGIYIDNQADYFNTPSISGNLIVGNKQGIYLLQGSATITDNDILSNRGPGILFDQGKGEINLNTIKYNAEPRNPPPWEEFTGIRLESSSDVWIHENNVSHNSQNIYLYSCTNINIEYNKMVDASAVIQVYPTPPPPRGIYAVSSQMTASNNKIWGMIFGMDIEGADSNTIISHNEFYPLVESPPITNVGIRLIGASAQIEWNTFDRLETGIYCTVGSDAAISDNTITNCFGTGIHTVGSSPTIVSNTIANNGGWGIFSEHAAPANAGTDGSGLIAANPGLGDNGLGRIMQVWEVQIKVMSGGVPQEDVLVQVIPYMGTPIFTGYTDADGLTESFVATQYVVENGASTPSAISHIIMCDGMFHAWLSFDHDGIYEV